VEPRLSVIMPAWNAEATIGAALASVLAETAVDLECVVVDDASTDGTTSVVEAIAADDPRVRLVRAPVNAGASAARNLALDVARGTWLAFLDADDRLLPGGLAAMMRAAEDRAALAVVAQRISTDGERTWIPKAYDWADIRNPGRKSVVGSPHLLYYAGPAGKVFHRSCTEGLRFEGRMLGDQAWVVRALLRAGDAIEVISDVVYEWRRPHRDHYVATISSARGRSASLAATAVGVALQDYRTIMEEVDRTLPPADRHTIAVTYLERLLQADLRRPLAHAVRSADPNLPGLLDAMTAFLEAIPVDVRRSTSVVGDAVIVPTLRRYLELSPAAQAACMRLTDAAVRADPTIITAVPGRGARAELRLSLAMPPAIGARVLAVLMRVRTALHRRGPRRAVPQPEDRAAALEVHALDDAMAIAAEPPAKDGDPAA
jgi:hypothetical protein